MVAAEAVSTAAAAPAPGTTASVAPMSELAALHADADCSVPVVGSIGRHASDTAPDGAAIAPVADTPQRCGVGADPREAGDALSAMSDVGPLVAQASQCSQADEARAVVKGPGLRREAEAGGASPTGQAPFLEDLACPSWGDGDSTTGHGTPAMGQPPSAAGTACFGDPTGGSAPFPQQAVRLPAAGPSSPRDAETGGANAAEQQPPAPSELFSHSTVEPGCDPTLVQQYPPSLDMACLARVETSDATTTTEFSAPSTASIAPATDMPPIGAEKCGAAADEEASQSEAHPSSSAAFMPTQAQPADPKHGAQERQDSRAPARLPPVPPGSLKVGGFMLRKAQMPDDAPDLGTIEALLDRNSVV